MAKKKVKKDAVVITARDMLSGFVPKDNNYNIFTMTPLQMIPSDEKDEEWKKWNLDWYERAGLRQLGRESRKISKNYHLANGVLDKSDYMIGGNNELSSMISIIANDETNLPLRFYPIIPQVINVMIGEFSKRDNRVIVKATDELSADDAYQYKKDMVTQILEQRMVGRKVEAMKAMGIDINSKDPQVQKSIQSDIEAEKQLADAETKFKTYIGIPEKWANHMIEYDNQRFNMYQMEIEAFRDSLIADREFWHIKVKEEDYTLELWNPKDVFYHKSPDVRYISEGNYVGRMLLMSISDVIDTHGDLMSSEQVETLKESHRTISNLPLVDDAHRDQLNQYTNLSKPYPQSQTNVTWGQMMDGKFADASRRPPQANTEFNWHDLSKYQGDYLSSMESPDMVRVTEVYWKSQRKIGKLVKISRDGTVLKNEVDESYVVTEKPVYNKSIHQVEKAENLVSGEHIDWIWINEIRWGVKINSSMSTYYTRNYTGFEPIYIGGDPIPFQFKGQDNLYGCKLPVEGRIFSERNSYSSSMVDKMKSFQIMHNVLNNQVMEMLADDPGKVIVVDQNMIPRNSLGGEWGKYNFPMFYQIMKDYQVVPIDPSVRNTEGSTNFSHFQAVDISKTEQLLARIQLADWSKNQCFQVVGIYPQRLGAVAASESATGVQQAVNNSYAQTESYFDMHMNHLMPRVRQMMLDAAQFINATKPKSRAAYMNTEEQNIWFDIEGYRLLLRDFKVIAKSTADVKATVDQLRRLAMENNTAGATLSDLAEVINLNSPAQIISKLREAEDKRQKQLEAQQQHEMDMQQQEQAFLQETEKSKQDREDIRQKRTIEKDILVAQIKASQSKTGDVNGNQVPDSLEAMDILHNQAVSVQELMQQQDKINSDKDNNKTKADIEREKLQVEREKMRSQEMIESLKLKNPVAGEKKKK